MRLACIVLACALAGCGDDTSNLPTLDLSAPGDDLAKAGTDLSGAADLSKAQDLLQSGDGAAAMATLKLEDYAGWCSVTVNSGTPGTADQTLTFPVGTVVHLSGDTASVTLFQWGYWIGTAGDVSVAHDTSMTTTVTMSGDKTVQACCPDKSSTPVPCPPPT
jgi:hypothetical protein